jgi:hypothetical protein
MLKIVLAAATLAATLVAGAVSAQSYPPMDMSWAIRSQMQNQQTGDAMVRAYQAQIYAALKRARAQGHPYNGVIMARNNPNTFGDGGYAARSQTQYNAVNGWDLQAVRGCTRLHRDQYGNTWYGC